MAVLTFSELQNLAFDRAQINVAQQAISCTLSSNTTVTSSALFGSIVAGMGVAGTGIPVGTTVTTVATTSSLTISQAATITGASTLTFSAVDAPINSTEFTRFINDAYADVWQVSGGRTKTVASATAWTGAQLCTGRVVGILTDVEDITHLYATTTAPAAMVTVTNGTTALTSAALFGSVTAGMAISGTGIAANTFVASVTDTSNLTMTIAATDSTSNSRTFSPTTGTNELDRVELSEVLSLRASSTGFPTYLVPKVYAISRRATATPGSVNLLQLDYWPSVTGFYFPMDYVPQFSPIDSATVTTPDVNDLESRDIALIAAARMAQAVGRAELVPGILADVSGRTQAALDRKFAALLDAKQDAA